LGRGQGVWEGRVMLLPLLLIAVALRRYKRRCQYCGHVQCEERCVDHCCPQHRSILSCSYIAAE
jgi:hypothetical protein